MSGNYHIVVVIERAEGLRAADSNGKSDPYVVSGRAAASDPLTFKTKVIEKTLDPVWNEEKTWLCEPKEDWTIDFNIYDKDVIGKDFLGHAQIDLKKEAARKENKEVERRMVLDLEPGPKTSEKTAKKITGKLHLRIKFPLAVLLDDESRLKIESRPDLRLDDVEKMIAQFREVSGGADIIDDKQKMALLAGSMDIFKLLIFLSANDDTTGFTPEVLKEIVADPEATEYFSRAMLVITDSVQAGSIHLVNYIIGYNLVVNAFTYDKRYQGNPNRDTILFKLMDMNADGSVSFDDFLAFNAFSPVAVKHKLAAEFSKDPKVATMKGKISAYQFNKVIDNLYNQFKYPDVLREIVTRMAVKVSGKSTLNEISSSQDQIMGYMTDETRRKETRTNTSRELSQMMKYNSEKAQLVLDKALIEHKCK